LLISACFSILEVSSTSLPRQILQTPKCHEKQRAVLPLAVVHRGDFCIHGEMLWSGCAPLTDCSCFLPVKYKLYENADSVFSNAFMPTAHIFVLLIFIQL